ncbi:hypothetical protein [Amycolatopsis pigmentata]|uniref:IrrE N-terminal-like domain-containing protein n=1 Tax=Amycolatopsis pigmentata TaxID=450801 RepID=A0ABW5FIJ4_9PSEU
MRAGSWKTLRERCARRVSEIEHGVGIPDPWSADEFIDRLERLRGREIDLCAVSWVSGESTGAWRRYADHDVIAYAANTSSIHQDLIILHEVGHLVLDHQGQCVLSVEDAQRLAPDLAPAAFAHLLDRVHGATEEHEAEMIATMILARIAAQRRRTRPVGARADLADRIETTFG